VTQHATLLQRLDASPAFHRVVKVLRLRSLAGLGLRVCPRVRRLPDSDIRYRIRYLETFVAADEIFTRGIYRPPVAPDRLTTFCDLGCNVGLFAALLAHLTGRRDLRGLMVDANPQMVEETRWLLQANRLENVVALHGLAGAAGSTDFYLSPSNLGSSQFPAEEPGKFSKADFVQTAVPALHLQAEWSRRFGDARCDLLKVDIEGSEAAFFREETEFLCRVDRIVLEWHKWVVSRETLDARLAEQGFRHVETLDETSAAGIAWYRREENR